MKQVGMYELEIASRVGVNSAIVLNNIVRLASKRLRPDGFTWCTSNEWQESTALTENQVKRALDKLVNLGYIEVKNTYITATRTKCRHYRIIPTKEIE